MMIFVVSRSGEMADAVDSKSTEGNLVWVQVPSSAYYFIKSALIIFMMCVTFVSCQTSSGYARDGDAYYASGYYADAAESYKKSLESRPLPQYRYNFAMSLVMAQNYSEAIVVLQELWHDYPTNLLILDAMFVCYIQLGDMGAAQNSIDQWLAVYPSDQKAMLYQAQLYTKQNKVKEAFQLIDEILKYGMDTRLLKEVAILYHDAGLKERAIFWLDEYNQKHSTIKSLDLLVTWYAESKNYPLAAKVLLDSLKLDNKFDKWFTLAKWQLTYLGEKEQGLLHLQKAIDEGFTDKAEARRLLEDPRLIDINGVRQILKPIM